MTVSSQRRFVYSSPYVPAEWLAAHGVVPQILRPSSAAADGPVMNRSGTCSYMRAFVNAAMSDEGADGIIIASQCDQMRRGADLIPEGGDKKIFAMHVPATWQTPAAYRYYIDELQRLSGFLIENGGAPPDQNRLVSTMTAFDDGRDAMVAEASGLRGESLTTALNELYRTGNVSPAASSPPGGVRVAVIGSALSREDSVVFDIIEQMGGEVVLDGTGNGETMLPGRFDRRQMRIDPFEELTNAYFFHIPSVSRRPNSGLFSWMKRKIDERQVEGVLLVRHTWCDLWHAEVHRVRDWLEVPVVDVDLLGGEGPGQAETRISALLEMLR